MSDTAILAGIYTVIVVVAIAVHRFLRERLR